MYRTIDTNTYDAQLIFGQSEITDSCWLWMGSMYNNGYGKIGKTGYMVHRIAYELLKGEVPTNMCLDHLCKQRNCINPEHLEIVTLVENVMRGESQHAKNARKTHCKSGHEFTDENTYQRSDRLTRECKICRHEAFTRHSRERGLTS